MYLFRYKSKWNKKKTIIQRHCELGIICLSFMLKTRKKNWERIEVAGGTAKANPSWATIQTEWYCSSLKRKLLEFGWRLSVSCQCEASVLKSILDIQKLVNGGILKKTTWNKREKNRLKSAMQNAIPLFSKHTHTRNKNETKTNSGAFFSYQTRANLAKWFCCCRHRRRLYFGSDVPSCIRVGCRNKFKLNEMILCYAVSKWHLRDFKR